MKIRSRAERKKALGALSWIQRHIFNQVITREAKNVVHVWNSDTLPTSLTTPLAFFHSPCHICLTLSSTSCGLSHPHPPSSPSLSSTYHAHPHKCSGGLSPSNKALDVDRQGRGGDKRPRNGYGLLGSQGRGWLLFTKAFKLKLTDWEMWVTTIDWSQAELLLTLSITFDHLSAGQTWYWYSEKYSMQFLIPRGIKLSNGGWLNKDLNNNCLYKCYSCYSVVYFLFLSSCQ